MPRQLRVFLCHASQDKPAVWNMYRYLKQHGISPWLDQADLLPGQDWEVEIPKAIFTSDVILVCLSKNSVNKEGYVQKEITFALDKAMEKPQGTIFIIPAKLEECDVHERLKRYQWVDYFRPDGRKRLLMGLHERVKNFGEDILPVILEDTRKIRKIEKSAVVNTEKHHPVMPLENDTDLLKELEKIAVLVKPSRKSNSRYLGVAGIMLIVLVLLGVISFLNNLPNKGGDEENTTVSTLAELPTLAMTLTPSKVLKTDTPSIQLTPTPIPAPALGIGSTMISGKDGMVMVFVPEGEFTMGEGSDEHQVYLNAFWIDQTEVTNAMYAKCLEENECAQPKGFSSSSRPNYFGNAEFNNYPVLYVDWTMAKTYCEWAGRKLPTEAQWEKAARGTDGRTYPSGEEIGCDKSNYSSCIGDTTSVGSYPDGSSIYGTLDMAGNVSEWVGSLYQPYPYDANDGREDLTANGPRVLRGGSWYDFAFNARSAVRFGFDPSLTDDFVGFRCSFSHP